MKRAKLAPDLATKTFTNNAERGTREFQQFHGLDVTGVVDDTTWEEAKKHGLLDTGFPDNLGLKPLNYQERLKEFGGFNYKSKPIPGNPENIEILGDWVAKNLDAVYEPLLVGTKGIGPSGYVGHFHKKAVEPFKNLIQDWHAQGLLDRVISWGGSWVPRYIRGSTTILSNHSCGTAFDINTLENPLGYVGAPLGAKGCVYELVNIAAYHGWYWGGFYAGRKDSQHWELARPLLPVARLLKDMHPATARAFYDELEKNRHLIDPVLFKVAMDAGLFEKEAFGWADVKNTANKAKYHIGNAMLNTGTKPITDPAGLVGTGLQALGKTLGTQQKQVVNLARPVGYKAPGAIPGAYTPNPHMITKTVQTPVGKALDIAGNLVGGPG